MPLANGPGDVAGQLLGDSPLERDRLAHGTVRGALNRAEPQDLQRQSAPYHLRLQKIADAVECDLRRGLERKGILVQAYLALGVLEVIARAYLALGLVDRVGQFLAIELRHHVEG